MFQQAGDAASLADNQQLVKAVSEILHAEEPTLAPEMNKEQQEIENTEKEERLLLLMKEMCKLEEQSYRVEEGDAEGAKGKLLWHETDFKAIPKEGFNALNLKW